MADTSIGTSAPKSFWIVAALSLLWNAFGGYDYTMTRTRNADYLSNFPPEMMPLIDAMPTWASVAWGLGVWGAVLGSILMLLRSRHAVTAFLISLVSALISFTHQYASGMPDSMLTPGFLAITAMIIASTVFFWWYARRQVAAGVLR